MTSPTRTKLIHPALSLPEPQQVEYVSAIASIVLADQKVDADELSRLRQLSRSLGISPKGEDTIIAFAKAPNHAQVARTMASIRDHKLLRFSMMTDALVVAFTDGSLAHREPAVLAGFAKSLGISVDAVTSLARFVEGILKGKKEGADKEELTRKLHDTLTDAGLPTDPTSLEDAILWQRGRLGA